MKNKNRKHSSNPGINAQRKMRSLLLNKKAASVVISTVVLTAGVIAMSIAVLYWTYSMGKIGNTEYQKNTISSSNAVEERIGYEYINGSGRSLTAYIINWGKSDNITITRVLILDSSYHYLGSNSPPTVVLRNIASPYAPIADNRLRLGADAFFTATLSVTLNPSQMYYVRIVTASGRNFDGSFQAQ